VLETTAGEKSDVAYSIAYSVKPLNRRFRSGRSGYVKVLLVRVFA
jgi:hypothetical protein